MQRNVTMVALVSNAVRRPPRLKFFPNGTNPMNPIDFLNARRSTPSRLLGAPGPDAAQERTLIEAALRVPDHGKLTPWRILRITGDQRARLGDYLVARQRERDPATPAAVLDKDRERFNHAPLVLTVIARPQPHKVPEIEQLMSAGAVCMLLLQAAQALGFGAQWLTGWMAYDDGVAARLGLSGEERIIGFIHIGTPRETAPERLRPALEDIVSDWAG